MSEERAGSGVGRAGLRASDADREQLISELHGHAVAGRLSTDELEQRVEAAYAAQTASELNALRSDLPLTGDAVERVDTARRRRLTRRLVQETGGAAGLFVVCLIIWLGSGGHDHGQFWPGWVLIVVALSLIRNGWALFGPAPDLDVVERQLDQRREHRIERTERRALRRSDR